MDLIEKLGGYEKAKRELKLKEENSMFQCCAAIDSRMIRDALLEYRRANNIFEVGDKVVTLPDHNPYPFVLTVGEDGEDGWFFESGGKYCNGAIFRHATIEEIKAGRRL